MWFWQKHIRRPNRMSYKLLNQSEQQFLPTHTKSIDDDASGATGVYTTNTMATRFRFSGIQVSRESANDADFFFWLYEIQSHWKNQSIGWPHNLRIILGRLKIRKETESKCVKQ